MRRLLLALILLASAAPAGQQEIGDAELGAASAGRTIAIGTLATGRSTTVAVETYVARVLAAEGEPRASEAAQQALAIAIRTFAAANAGRHRRDGFDLCDSTHCQVLRASTAATRRAAVLTAGRILTWNGRPAEVFYSASCGGRSESADNVWPGANLPYLRVNADDVHDADRPWMVEITLEEIEQALRRVGFEGGRLRQVSVEERSESGRAARLRLTGLRPDAIAGDRFRLAIGAGELRSTAFELEVRGETLRFTGRGYGHGVGMCVVGAGRRAMRGESAEAILAQYFPGLELTPGRGFDTRPPAVELDSVAARAHDALSKALGVSVWPITVRMHDSIEGFRAATGRPWWVSVVTSGTTIHLAPAPMLAQREGIDTAVRQGVAQLLLGAPLAGRPEWVRVGAARYYASAARDYPEPERCPSDAELLDAISAAAQRDAEARATACFARALDGAGEWRSVR